MRSQFLRRNQHLAQWCVVKPDIMVGSRGVVLNCSVCQFLRYKYSHHGWFLSNNDLLMMM